MLNTYQFYLASVVACLLLLSGCGGQDNGASQTGPTASQNISHDANAPAENADIAILQHPQSVNITAGNPFRVRVTTKSDTPLRYQWYKNDEIIQGANSPSFFATTSTVADSGLYHVVVSNDYLNLSSYAAAVNISPENGTLRIIHSPLSKTIPEGQALQLAIEVMGQGPITYQWYKNGSRIAGANGSTLQIPNSRQSDAGFYQVVVANSTTTLESDFANVSISDSFLPPAEISFTAQPKSTSTTETQPFSLSVLAYSADQLRYQWYKNNEAINGAVNATYSVPASALDDQGVYYVIASNQQKSVKSFAAYVQVKQSVSALTITRQPQGSTLSEGQSLSLQVEADGNGPLAYQWYKNSYLIPGATNRNLEINNIQSTDSGYYRVQISSGRSSIVSSSASVLIVRSDSLSGASPDSDLALPPYYEMVDDPQSLLAIARQPQNKTIAEGDALVLEVEVTGDGPFTYQWQKNGSLLPNATDSNYFVTSAKKSDQATYRVLISNAHKTVYSAFVTVRVTDRIAPVKINTHPESQVAAAGSFKHLQVSASGGGHVTYQWRKNGVPIPYAFSSSLMLDGLEEEDTGFYDVIVANSQGSKISNAAYLQVRTSFDALLIHQQPASQTILQGQPVNLSVVAQSDSALSYQWSLNDLPIPGANTATYNILQADASDAGIYTVLISDGLTSLRSLPAHVSLYQPSSYAIELSWDTPRFRQDGSALDSDEILEYVIELGYEDHLLDEQIVIPYSTENRYVLDNMSPGRLYLRIATVDINGDQGPFSDIISLNIE